MLTNPEKVTKYTITFARSARKNNPNHFKLRRKTSSLDRRPPRNNADIPETRKETYTDA